MPDERRTGDGAPFVWWTIDADIARASTRPEDLYAHFHSILTRSLSSE